MIAMMPRTWVEKGEINILVTLQSPCWLWITSTERTVITLPAGDTALIRDKRGPLLLLETKIKSMIPAPCYCWLFYARKHFFTVGSMSAKL